MFSIKMRRLWYQIKYRYPTREFLTIIGAAMVVFCFLAGSVQSMQKNYELRRQVEYKQREAKLIELEMKTLEYEQSYLKSEEYQKLAVRQRIGYGDPGEKLLILPANSPDNNNENLVPLEKKETPPPSNLQQWMNFLFGGNARK
jgi:hypothetical protein cdivTM7_00627